MKRILLSGGTLLLTISALSLSSCKRDDGEQIDHSKTVIQVGNIEGGVGEEWLKLVKERFEEMYKDYENGGKKGVQVLYTSSKNVAGQNIGTSLKTLPYDVYFTELVYYNDLVANNDLLDITDAVTEPLTECNETKSISDKIYSDYKDYLTVNNKIYAVPHYDSSYAMYYDQDMFDNYGFYFKGDSNNNNRALKNGDAYIFVDSDEQLSSGPNGVSGDYDDGLPATYEQFFALCKEMKNSSVTPVTYSGTYKFYLTRFMQTLASAAMGDEANLFFNFNGTTTKYVEGFDENNNPILNTEPITITEETGYKSFHLAGKYYALDFVEKLVDKNYINKKSFSSYGHLDAQQDFIKGSYRSTYSDQSVENYGILIEGSWWSNESKSFYNDMANGKYGNGALEKNRHISIMPLPHLTDAEIGEKTNLLCDANLSLGFIKQNIDNDKKDICKKFLRFCYTDVSLSEFSGVTNMLKGVDYDISEEDLAKMSNYGKSLIQYRKDCKVIYPFSTSKIYRNYSSSFILDGVWDSIVSDVKYNVPVSYLKDVSGATAKKYFNGMKANYNATYWAGAFRV